MHSCKVIFPFFFFFSFFVWVFFAELGLDELQVEKYGLDGWVG